VTSRPAPPDPVVRADVSPDPIDPARLVERVGGEGDGAVVLFLGTVRDHNHGRTVTSLAYEAYVPMARRELAAIAREALALHGASRIAAAHRTGTLEPGTASVGIAVAAEHRDAAYRASRHVIEEVKRRLPVWKEERYADGGRAWLEGHPAPGAPARDATPAGAPGEGDA